MQRCFTNIISQDVEKTATFYQHILGMKRHYDSDWFVILTHENVNGLELGILQCDHATVPKHAISQSCGVIITFVVPSSHAVHELALSRGIEVLEPPTKMPYGQTRLIIRDPDGTILDVSSQTPKEPG